MLYGTLGSPNNTTIPAVGAAQEDGPALKAASTASIAIGPSDYDYFSGTSMATPTTSGVAALVWSNHPGCSNVEVRAALKATAEDQGAPGRDDYYGYGIIKAKAASDALESVCGGITQPSGDPTARFSFDDCPDLTCSFDASESSDSDGTIVSYNWSFGGTGVTAVHTFGASGTYTVTLTVTDDDGKTASTSQNVPVTGDAANIVLEGTRYNGGRSVTLDWTGASGANVDVYVNGNLNNSTANDGSVSYSVNKRASYTFKICETGSTTTCSNDVNL
jgi:PKD repeat protein